MDQIVLELAVMSATPAANMPMNHRTPKSVVTDLDPVACMKISISGNPVGVSRTAAKSEMLASKATPKGQARTVPNNMGSSMALGTFLDGDGISSAICAGTSVPR